MDELISASAASLARLVRNGDITSERVVQAHLERIRDVNPKLNAVVQLTADSALASAKRADQRIAKGDVIGPLDGVPMTVKDSFETAGVVSTAGTSGLRDHVPGQNATVVDRLEKAGAILLGKTNVPEITLRFLTDNDIYGRTNNPYDVSRIPAGSSGGAAAIVAAGGSAFDIGSDTGGSIRLPAAFCGIAGLKPTRGRVPRTGHIPFLEFGPGQAFTQVGPLARAVEDLALLLPILSGPDGFDPFVFPVAIRDPDGVRVADLRVAYYTQVESSTPDDQTMAVVTSAVEALARTGAAVRNDKTPGADSAPALWRDIFLADGGAGVRSLLQKLGTPTIHQHLSWTQSRDAVDGATYQSHLENWIDLQRDGLRFLDLYDVVICPVNATPAPLHGAPTPFRFTYLYNLLGWPVCVVRCGTSDYGLPIGVQIVAPPWREDIALAVASHLERALGGWSPPPI